MAPRAGEVLRAAKEPPGVEQNGACVQDPVMVTRLFLKQPARIDAVGVVVWRARLLWRVRERSRRRHVDTPGNALAGGDTPETTRPTAFMGLQGGPQRQRAQALSAVQPQDLAAVGVPTAECIGASNG